ncbi:MAG: TonB-dependent receptor plug domain-containing protein [Gemmatimonadota bacterium]
MIRPLSLSPLLLLGAVLVSSVVAPIRAQEPQRADTLMAADTLAADTLAADTLASGLAGVGTDPRLTWLGDTLAVADTIRPKFTELPEVWPDSLVDIYTIDRPGAWAAWTIPGTALLGRGAFSLLDVLEEEFLILPQDLGGSGLATFMGSAHGTGTGVQVVIDGLPAGTPLTAAWDLRQFPLEAIAEVEWFPGPQVAAWGGSGTGGVLSITTRRSLAPGARSMIAFLLGSTDAQAFSGFLARPVTRRGDLFIGANFDSVDGLNHSGDFTRNQTFVRAGWRISEKHRIEVSRRGDGLAGRENRLLAGATPITGSEDHDTAAVHLFYTGQLGPLSAGVHAQRQTEDFGEAFEFGGPVGLLGKGERIDIRADVNTRVGDWLALWAGGARVEEEAVSQSPLFFSGNRNLLEADSTPSPIVPRIATEATAGAGFGGPADPFAGNVVVRRLAYDDRFDGATAWQIEALGRPIERLTLRAAAGSSLRPPSFVGQAVLERFAEEGIEVHPGRPADPRTLERWTEWRAEASWSGDDWRVAARAWRATGEDAFLWLPPTAWMRFDPSSTAFRIGLPGFNTFDVVDLTSSAVEADVFLPLPLGIDGVLRAGWLDQTVDATGERVPYVPEVQALGQLRYARRFFPSRDLLVEARVTGRFMGDRPTISGEDLPAVLVGDILVQATVINLTVYVSLKNFAGQEIQTEEGFELPGYEGYLGINWRFRN